MKKKTKKNLILKITNFIAKAKTKIKSNIKN